MSNHFEHPQDPHTEQRIDPKALAWNLHLMRAQGCPDESALIDGYKTPNKITQLAEQETLMQAQAQAEPWAVRDFGQFKEQQMQKIQAERNQDFAIRPDSFAPQDQTFDPHNELSGKNDWKQTDPSLIYDEDLLKADQQYASLEAGQAESYDTSRNRENSATLKAQMRKQSQS